MNLVVDASAGFELILETVPGRALLQKLPRPAEWWVPEHYFVEVAAALRRAEYRGDITGRPQPCPVTWSGRPDDHSLTPRSSCSARR